jgi:hypothetical protein
MGAEQSNRHERPRKTRQPGQATVEINRTDPDLQEALEAYANVGMDPAIIERIIQDQERELANQQISTPPLKNVDTQKKKSKEKKKKEIQQEQSDEVNNQQQLDTKIRQPQPEREVNQKQQQQYGEEQLREKSRQFNETAERVERIFLSKHQPNACVENEQVSSIII